MSDDDCPRAYPANPDTAENPCEDCGRDERKHATPPSNVLPMRGHTHECPSCHAQIVTERIYEGHADTCMQPEIRMRRAEARILELINAVNTQTENVERLVARIEDFISHGKPTEDIEPDTKRSGTLTDARSFGIPGGPGRVKWLACSLHFPGRQPGCEACDSGLALAHAEPAEPAGEAPAGAEPAPGGPERPR